MLTTVHYYILGWQTTTKMFRHGLRRILTRARSKPPSVKQGGLCASVEVCDL